MRDIDVRGLIFCPNRTLHQGKHNGIWKNVLFILYRIVILTIMYQVWFLVAQFVDFVSFKAIGWELLSWTSYTILIDAMLATVSIMFSLSMYLMMDHNTVAYIRLLQFMRNFYLKYICFMCCHHMVDRQLAALESDSVLNDRSPGISQEMSVDKTEYENTSTEITCGIILRQESLPTLTVVTQTED